MENITNCEYLIAGAGISGVTLARILAEKGKKVTITERRETVGGNLYDYVDENGITVQLYGPHIFHTNNEKVFSFLSRFTEWTFYEHRVLGLIDGKYVPIPFNLTSLKALFESERARKIESTLISEVGKGVKIPITELKAHPDPLIREFADFVYKKVFEFYTEKQWGCKIEELGDAVSGRVPVYVSEEDRYFTDKFQFQPSEGFTRLVENMLDHSNITIIKGKDAVKSIAVKDGNILIEGQPFHGKLIYTGRIDELFGECFGALPYRSLDFAFETHDSPSYQQAAVVNYTTSEKFTRISEFTKFTCTPKDKTVIVKEYSKTCNEGDIPYYPIPKQEYKESYARYAECASEIKNLYLAGRLACYRYLNMDAAVAEAMELAEKISE